jgi:squalene-hopene/tetraprenyl-beta-curcumene cyclase
MRLPGRAQEGTLAARLERAYQQVQAALLAARTPAGHWIGELSSSALSTATAVAALAVVQEQSRQRLYESLIKGGLAWLAAQQNADGGWGDTPHSPSNLSTTLLCRAAFFLAGSPAAAPLAACDRWLHRAAGPTPQDWAQGVQRRYGKDRTFSVPILLTCALAGFLPWEEVPPLPFELACLPMSWFPRLRLPVVSYALPALIALGQAIFAHRPPRNPLQRLLRQAACRPSLRVLQTLQPVNGGFLEATPLTSFVILSLASLGQVDAPVVQKGIAFLVSSVRADGSWPIDTNLATWVTTLAVNALAAAGEGAVLDREQVTAYLLGQQFRQPHPYTGAAPGGWAWTHLPGGVPDADDTAGALLAGSQLASWDLREKGATPWLTADPARPGFIPALAGLRWLMHLQNRDGGWPTFCRGWGYLPFDRSGPDLTAHALRALCAWERLLFQKPAPVPEKLLRQAGLSQSQLRQAQARGWRYLQHVQQADGSWRPLWFGNQLAPEEENPTYGTARVLAACHALDKMTTVSGQRAVAWLQRAQNADGGWGGDQGVPSSVEETALALEALLAVGGEALPEAWCPVVNKGLAWLVEQVEQGGLERPAPIGLYFARLWYQERLYPVIFTLAALGRARRLLSRQPP